MSDMNRHEFISLLGGAATAWPLVARAQQPAIAIIGFLSSRSSGDSEHLVTAFREGLKETGYVEGENAVIAFRWAEGRYDRLPALAADLVGRKVDLILTEHRQGPRSHRAVLILARADEVIE
jgi:putative tryptophan/tyrosine transport system substrate-binding protein